MRTEIEQRNQHGIAWLCHGLEVFSLVSGSQNLVAKHNIAEALF